MITKKETRLRRSRKTRAKIAEMNAVRLSVFRSNSHIYAQVIAGCGSKVLAAASTLEAVGTEHGQTDCLHFRNLGTGFP